MLLWKAGPLTGIMSGGTKCVLHTFGPNF